jgi:hypothetical protein
LKNLNKKGYKKKKITKILLLYRQLLLRSASDRRLLVAPLQAAKANQRSPMGRPTNSQQPLVRAPSTPPLVAPVCTQIFLWLVNSSSLPVAHASLAQTSPKNFKHP